MPRQRNYQFRSNAAGAGLIEVLIAVLVMAIGLLGIASMQATALRNSQSSLERSQAVIQSYAILDSMRANLDQARGGAYNLARACQAPDAGGTLATNDLNRWINSLHDTLNPAACGQVACVASVAAPGAQDCTIRVEWDDSRGLDGEGDFAIETESTI